MASNFKFKDNTELVLKGIADASNRATEEMGTTAVESVQYQMLYGYKDPHGDDGHTEIVDTGQLFESIVAETRRQSQNLYTTTIGTDKEYAVFVHNGTKSLKARRFITDGINRIRDSLVDILKSNLKNG